MPLVNKRLKPIVVCMLGGQPTWTETAGAAASYPSGSAAAARRSTR